MLSRQFCFCKNVFVSKAKNLKIVIACFTYVEDIETREGKAISKHFHLKILNSMLSKCDRVKTPLFTFELSLIWLFKKSGGYFTLLEGFHA